MTLKLTDTDYTDWRWGGHARSTGPSVPGFANLNSTGVYCWQFANAKELHFSDLQIPHDYAEGTVLTPHIHFCATSATRITGTWTLDFIDWLDVGATPALQAKQTVTYAFDVNPPTAFRLITANFNTTFTGTNRKISSCAHARLSLALSSGADVALCGLDCHYEINTLGSRTITAK